MEKTCIRTVSLIISYLIILLCGSCKSETAEEVDLMAIRNCAELETARFSLRKIVVYDATRKIVGLMGHDLEGPQKLLILPVEIEVAGKIDFSHVTEENITESRGNVVFVLPDPVLTIVRDSIDEEMRERASREGWARLRGHRFTDDEEKQVARQAYDSIMVERCLRMMLDRTRENAADILIPLVAKVKGVSEEKVDIQFRSDLRTSDAWMRDDGDTKEIIFRRRE